MIIPITVLIIILGLIISVIPFLKSAPAAFISYSRSLNIGETVLLDEKYGTVEDINGDIL